MEEELILTGMFIGITIHCYLLAFFSTHINMCFGAHRRNTFFIEKLKKHNFKGKRIVIFHGMSILLFLIMLLLHQFIGSMTWSSFFVFPIFHFIVVFYTMTAISMKVYNKRMEDEPK